MTRWLTSLILLVLLLGLLAVVEAEHKLITCVSCTAKNPRCRRTCQGLYCYKTEALIDDERYVKRGCLNHTDMGIIRAEVDGACRTEPAPFGVGTETMCVCKSRDHCNSTFRASSTLVLSLVFSLYVIFGR